MIKNEKQYSITKSKRNEFSESLEAIVAEDNNDLLKQVMIDAIVSQLETFDREIREYEKLKNDRPNIINSSIDKLPETLIKARIAKGYSQSELAQRTGLKEQQIQRYESNNYETANIMKLLSIAKSMDVHFEDTKAILSQEVLEVEGYDPCFLREATSKLQLRRSLFTV
jgi:HTH-type transcriptional regulator / antitoxin HipB